MPITSIFPAPSSHNFRNSVLGALERASLERLRVEAVNPERVRRSLTVSGRNPDHIFFLETGYVSVMVPLANGSFVSAGILGSRSIIGASALAGGRPLNHYYELPALRTGQLYACPVEEAQREFNRSEQFQQAVLGSLCGEIAQAVQLSACNALHDVQQRLSRWLLLCHDEIDGNDIATTHEMIAGALGICRSTATVALDLLRRDGALAGSRAHIRILDRATLESRACECYAIIRASQPGQRRADGWTAGTPRPIVVPAAGAANAGDGRASAQVN